MGKMTQICTKQPGYTEDLLAIMIIICGNYLNFGVECSQGIQKKKKVSFPVSSSFVFHGRSYTLK